MDETHADSATMEQGSFTDDPAWRLRASLPFLTLMTQAAHEPAPTAQPAPAGEALYDCFQFMDDRLRWLESYRLTYEQAEETIRRACAMVAADGATPDEIVRYFAGIHGIPPEEMWRVSEFAALCAHRGRIQRTVRGRFVSHYDKGPWVLALLQIRIEDWPFLEKYKAHGSRAFMTGAGEEA